MKTKEKIKSLKEKVEGFVKGPFKGKLKTREKRTLFETVFNAISIIILFIAYLLIGLIIAIPYTYLAGWDVNNVASATLFSPFVLAFLCIFYLSGRKVHHSNLKGFNITFWVSLIYFFLPVIANGVSIILNWANLPYGNLIFEYRYNTLLVFPVIVMIVLVYGFLESVWNWLFKNDSDNQVLNL
jgi:hypothetical protein